MKITKLITITFASLLFSQISQSQTNPKKVYIGGESNLNFSIKKSGFSSDNQSSQDNSEFTTFSLTPKVGFFTTHELVLGVSIPFEYNKLEILEFSEERSRRSLIFAPFIQYYLSNSNIKPFLFGTIGAGTITEKNKYSGLYQSETTETKNGLVKAAGGLGVAFFMNKSISLDLLVQYEYLARTPEGENPNNDHIYSKGFDFKFGISGYL